MKPFVQDCDNNGQCPFIIVFSFSFFRWDLSLTWMVICFSISFYKTSMIPWQVSSLFSSSTPWTRQQFLLEYCFLQSTVLSALLKCSFKDFKSSFRSTALLPFSFRSASNSLNFSLINLLGLWTSSICLALLI